MERLHDVAVIGGGPGGYIAAIRCAQLGLSTVCIDAWTDAAGKPSLGGTCLNVGCIPSKVVLESSENYERARRKFADHGVVMDGVRLDLGRMMTRKQEIVGRLTSGIGVLMRKHKVEVLHGSGRLLGNNGVFQIEATLKDGTQRINARHVIIATGSVPAALPGTPFDHERIVDSTGALAFDHVPNRIALLGAGVIALELGSVWRRLGSEVMLYKPRPGLLPTADERIAREAERIFSAQGMKLHLGTQVSNIRAGKKGVSFEVQDANGTRTEQVDRFVVAIGRKPYTGGLGLDKIGVKLDAGGGVVVDDLCRTNIPNAWAIGDVVRGTMLAHKASAEGVMVAERIAGQASRVNYGTIPFVIYTSPEIAWVGQTGQELRRAGIPFKSGAFPFKSNGRAQGLGELEGLTRMLAHAETDRILGVHIIGPYASEMIAEAVVAMEFSACSEDVANIVHAHPSLAEVMHEAALAAGGRAMHS